MVDVRFDTYYRHDDLQSILKQFAEQYPRLMRLDSIGTSYEGRDISVATVTRFSTVCDFYGL